ncbi:unnamed protein product [Absidia cylindrospora]
MEHFLSDQSLGSISSTTRCHTKPSPPEAQRSQKGSKTVTSTRLVANDRYSFTEVRSAAIPTYYGQRFDWVKVIELLLKLKNDLVKQEEVQ